jgi:hypothetical protein
MKNQKYTISTYEMGDGHVMISVLCQIVNFGRFPNPDSLPS